MMEKLMSKSEVCQLLGISLSTLDRIVLDGTLPAFRVRGQVRFKPSDLDAYLERCREQHRPIAEPGVRGPGFKPASPAPVCRYVPGMKVV